MSYTIEKQDPVLVAFSGGAKSNICAQILKDQAFRVEGLYFGEAEVAGQENAVLAAEKLEIPLYIKPLDDFGSLTDIQLITLLAEEADTLGIHFIATGHAARLTETGGIYTVAAAADVSNDQSTLLDGLSAATIERLCLPVGEFSAEEINEMVSGADTE